MGKQLGFLALAAGAVLMNIGTAAAADAPSSAPPAITAPVLHPSPMTPDQAQVVADLESRASTTEAMAREFWDNPELGYLEFKTSARMVAELRKAGFTITTGVAGIPTAFIASYGTGGPIIGILAEMDALPGKSQAAAPHEQEIPGRHNNQACGHNLFSAGSVAAAIAVKDWLAHAHRAGTIRLYGAPAEEGGAGKVYLVRAGVFKDVDAVLHWHPAMVNGAINATDDAVMSAKFRFHGIASHAATSPEHGRSALEAVEAMEAMVNMMREHIGESARISSIITHGGSAPNVVPDFAEIYYYVRETSVDKVRQLWARVLKTAAGAAMGTETTFDYEIIHGTYNNLPNTALEQMMNANLRKRAAAVIRWTPEEHQFAAQLYKTIHDPWLPLGSEAEVAPFQDRFTPGSSDVGDISWSVPTAGLVTTTWVPSTDAHTWQATAVGGMGIGFKGMHLASQVIAMTAVDLLQNPAVLKAAKQEIAQRRGPHFVYAPLIGNRKPPLDYRKTDNQVPSTE